MSFVKVASISQCLLGSWIRTDRIDSEPTVSEPNFRWDHVLDYKVDARLCLMLQMRGNVLVSPPQL